MFFYYCNGEYPITWLNTTDDNGITKIKRIAEIDKITKFELTKALLRCTLLTPTNHKANNTMYGIGIKQIEIPQKIIEVLVNPP
ncbi:MAG: hypothetical protein K2F52_02255 [Malacoplasma sp.]|nr:hypothetical protein [Malacoplasma sp.]